MDNKAKSKSKLNFELQELQQKYDSLLLSIETDFEQSKLPKDVLKDIAERKLVHHTYRKSEARYLGLLQNLEAGVVVHAPDTSVLMANAIAEEILGLTSDQMNGKVAIDPLWKLLKEDTTILPFEEYPVNRIAKTKKSIKNQILGIYHPIKNSMVWATINGFPMLDTKGEIVEIVISFIDITERKLAEKSLAKSEENLRITLHSIGDGVISTDIAGRVTHMNPIAEKLSGWKFDDAKGKLLTKIFNIINAESRKKVENPVEKVMENGEIVGLANHTVLVSKNGNEYQIADSAAPIKNKNGLISGVVLVFSDITEKYATEKQLKESEERFNLAMNASSDGLFDWNLVTNEIYYSPGWKKMLGYEDHEIPNDFSFWEKMTDPEGVKKSWDMQQQLISKQIDRFVMEFKMKHKNGHWVDILSRGEAIFNESGDAIRMVGTHVDITKQRKVEKELKKAKEKAEESKEYLDNIINNVGDPLFVKDEESRLLLVNEAFCKLFGLTKSKIIGKTLTEDVAPEERESFLKIDKQVLSNGIENINEESLTVRGGETRTISTRKTRFLDSNGDKYLVGVIRDITNIKKAQLELILAKQKAEESELNLQQINSDFKRSNQLLEASQSTAKLGGWELNLLTDELYWTAETYRIHDTSPEEFNPTVDAGVDYYLPESKQILTNALELAISQGKNYDLLLEMLTTKGRKINVRTTANVTSVNGKPIKLTGIFQDITEVKKKERELILAKQKAEESEEQYKLIAENASDVVWIIDFETNTLKYVSPSIKLQRGYTQEEAMTQCFNDYLTPDSLEYLSSKIPERIERFKQGIREYFNDELEQFCKDGSTICTEVKAKYVKNKKTGKVEIVGVTRDISAQKKYQNELITAKQKAEESDRLKSAFLANMSHEIRTPMNGILGFSELLKTPNLSGEQQQKYIGVIEKSGNRMLNIINDIVDISKIEAGLMKLDIKESDVNRQIEYLYTFFKPEVETKGMQLFMNNTLPKNEAIVETDREKLFAILTNLIKNAIKYSNKGSIEFGYEKNGDYLEFYVKDTGIGIPRDRQEAIFERFIQADIEDEMARQGAGLGLAITKSYVEMLGGSIWLESEEGVGSTFYFTLPYNSKTKEKNIPKADEVNHNTKKDIKNLKTLIVEDDEASKILLSINIREFSNDIINARTGVEAIEICKKNPDIDLVLMDIQLPEMNGYEATRKIREFNKNVIIIAQTAYGLSGDREKSMSAGCDDYMTKPIKKDKLESLIEKYFTQNL